MPRLGVPRPSISPRASRETTCAHAPTFADSSKLAWRPPAAVDESQLTSRPDSVFPRTVEPSIDPEKGTKGRHVAAAVGWKARNLRALRRAALPRRPFHRLFCGKLTIIRSNWRRLAPA